MEIPFVNLKRQYQSIKSEIDTAIQKVVESQYFTAGPELANFEQKYAEYLGSKYVIGVDNGTDGLTLALRALGVRPGDEVITQANIHVATIVAIIEAGAKPVLVDINLDTHQIDIEQVKTKITPKTKVLMPVHLYGAPCQIDQFVHLAQERKLQLIEDACQAHGTTFNDQRVGTFGVMGVFSFYAGKNLGAYGYGGAICTADPEIDKRLMQLRNFGEEKKYFHPTTGINSKLHDLQAAVLNIKLKYLDQWNEGRNKIADLYKDALSKFKTPRIIDSGKSNYHLFVIEVDQRDELLTYLNDKGIRAQIHYPTPVHLQPGYSFLGYKAGDLPVTERIAKRIISLPIYAELKEEEVEYICREVKKFYS